MCLCVCGLSLLGAVPILSMQLNLYFLVTVEVLCNVAKVALLTARDYLQGLRCF